jgi:Amt family ammonium transporter
VVFVKQKMGYDDALDAFGVHGIGGLIGSVGVGIFATPLVQSQYSGLLCGNPRQLTIQLLAVAVTTIFSLAGTLVLYKLLDVIMGVRVTEKEETMGLDVTQHNERAYTILE